MAWSIVKPLGARSGRWTALTMPRVALRSRPKGLPIASTSSPTRIAAESPSGSGRSARELASTLSSAMSVEGSLPTIFAFIESLFEKLTSTVSAFSMTWKFVTM